MPNEPSLGEVVRRIDRMESRFDRMESRFEELIREMGLRVVPADVYSRDRAETERWLVEMRRDLEQECGALRAALAEERTAREQGDRQIRTDLDARAQQSGTNIRQAIYAGLLPAILFLVSTLITLSQARGGK